MNLVEQGLYYIIDHTANSTSPLFEAINDKVAERGFKQQVKAVRGEMTLLKLGTVTHDDGNEPRITLQNAVIICEVKDDLFGRENGSTLQEHGITEPRA